jgi:hypothetical protein
MKTTACAGITVPGSPPPATKLGGRPRRPASARGTRPPGDATWPWPSSPARRGRCPPRASPGTGGGRRRTRAPRPENDGSGSRALWLKSFRRRESVACHCVGVPEVHDERELRLAVQRQPRDGAVRDALQSRQEREQDPTRRDT